MANRHIALLRGVNVGGKNRLPMKDLVGLFEAEGCEGVTTYIQSGNVVFDAGAGVVRGLPERLSGRIEESAGLSVPVILRTAAELAAVAAAHPHSEAADSKHLHVVFLADRPPAARVRALDAERSPGDIYRVEGREIFLCCPKGMARTKLTNAYFDRALDTVSTTRNWRTVQTLLELSQR